MVEFGKLPAPPLFTALSPHPRLALLPREKRTAVNAGRNACVTGGDGGCGSGGVCVIVAAVIGNTDDGPSRSRAGTIVSSAASASASVTAVVPGAEPGPLVVRAPTTVALDEYLSWVGDAYYTATESGAACRDWALLRRTTLGRLTAPAREGHVFDSWTPLQVAKFEGAICLYGKNFSQISKVRSKKRDVRARTQARGVAFERSRASRLFSPRTVRVRVTYANPGASPLVWHLPPLGALRLVRYLVM